jgi:hypothetical protein
MAIDELIKFVTTHTQRGECQCGKCIDKGNAPDPTGHVADLCFFKVAAVNNPDAQELFNLVIFGPLAGILDGQEHGYMEIGGMIGSQDLALQLMGLGTILGLWNLYTPKSMLGDFITDDQAMDMAGNGLVSIQVRRR